MGPIPVELVPDLTEDGQALAGCAYIQHRRVALDSTLEDSAMRVVLYHEMLHVWLHDAGVTVAADLEEVIVQALATALVAREDFHLKGAPADPSDGVPAGDSTPTETV
jgi:hypothetical protein